MGARRFLWIVVRGPLVVWALGIAITMMQAAPSPKPWPAGAASVPHLTRT